MAFREIKLFAFPFKGEGSLGDCIKHLANLTRDDQSENITGVIDKKMHIKYLSIYLREIKTNTIIIEHSYLDRDLVSDSWAFLADDIHYGKRHNCVRLHFFNKSYSKIPTEDELSEIEWDQLHRYLSPGGKNNKYLGFAVVLFSGDNVFLRACLKTYPVGEKVPCVEQLNTDTESRRIPALRKYKANLVGHELTVNSLGFREQDRVTSACATCAIWFVLQKSSKEHNHSVPSPGEITARALDLRHPRDLLQEAERGLSAKAMQSFFRSIPELKTAVQINTPNPSLSKKERDKHRKYFTNMALQFMLPILELGLPVIAILKKRKKERTRDPLHAIAVVGYNYKRESNPSWEEHWTNISKTDKPSNKSRADKITSLIAHDDNIGPFVQYNIEPNGMISFSLQPRNDREKAKEKIEGELRTIICVMHKSIKTYRYAEIYRLLSSYKNMFLGMLAFFKLDLERPSHSGKYKNAALSLKELECYAPAWVIKIWRSNDYKREIFRLIFSENSHSEKLELSGSEKLPTDIKTRLKKLLTTNFPEYIMTFSVRNDVRPKNKFAHDIIFSLADPWKAQTFITIAPFDEYSIKSFWSATILEKIPKSRICIQILNYISDNYRPPWYDKLST